MAIRFLSKQNVKNVWAKEDADFTPWVASLEPLTHLFEACGLDVGELSSKTLINQEVFIPGAARRLDVLVTLESGEKIAIENQFSALDHDHLTRALAYAVGLEARTIIILAEFHKEEFRSVVEYLNSAATVYEHGIKIFLVQFEVLSTPGSQDVYPNFQLVEGPNEWKGAIESSQSTSANSEIASLIYDFHDKALPFVREATGLFTNVSPSKNNWKASGLGATGLQILYSVAKDYCTIQIWFHGNLESVTKAGFEALQNHMIEIGQSMAPLDVDWRITDRTAVIEVTIENFGYKTENDEAKFVALGEKVLLMTNLAKTHLTEIKSAMAEAK